MTAREWIAAGGTFGGILGCLLGVIAGLFFALATIFGESNLHTYWTNSVHEPLSFVFYIFMVIVVLVGSVSVGTVIVCAVGYGVGVILGVVSSPLSMLTKKTD